ncbi:hypothetical protein TI05_12495, partial [Achromatium sp. WMS3]
TNAAEPLQIICGAANVTAGLNVPVALQGAVLPGNLSIKRTKLRGIESCGMICSAAELGLEEKSAGIMPLPAAAPIGQDFFSYLSLNDNIIELELTPDRSDCLSLNGIAREIGAINKVPVTPIKLEPIPAQTDATFQVHLMAPQACPRYACRIIQDLDLTATTPLWMQDSMPRSLVRLMLRLPGSTAPCNATGTFNPAVTLAAPQIICNGSAAFVLTSTRQTRSLSALGCWDKERTRPTTTLVNEPAAGVIEPTSRPAVVNWFAKVWVSIFGLTNSLSQASLNCIVW